MPENKYKDCVHFESMVTSHNARQIDAFKYNLRGLSTLGLVNFIGYVNDTYKDPIHGADHRIHSRDPWVIQPIFTV